MPLSNVAIGCSYSLAAAAAHSCVESLRKHASSQIPMQALVALPSLVEAIICLAVDTIKSEDGPAWMKISDGSTVSLQFMVTVIASSCILLFARVLYQRALSVAPLSLTVPFLSFTPVLLVFIAFVFLNERPSSLGLIGVLTVGLGGYLLGRMPQKDRAEATDIEDGFVASRGSLNIVKGGKSHRRNTSSSMTDSPSSSNLNNLVSRGSVGSLPTLDTTKCALPAPSNTAPLLMVVVASLFSITSSLDKLGLTLSPNHTVFVYVTFQRTFIFLLTSCSLAMSRPQDFRFLLSHVRIIAAIACCELLSVLFFLAAIDHLHVAYVVAMKRANILFSVIVGAVFFGEPIRDRVKFILMMMAGCVLIVLEPDQSAIHHELHHHRPLVISTIPLTS